MTAPPGLDGHSLRPQLEDPTAPESKPARGFWSNGQSTLRTSRWRLIVQSAGEDKRGRVELFDYTTDPGETRNHADAHPEVVDELGRLLDAAGVL